jgi:hypothetical protein
MLKQTPSLMDAVAAVQAWTSGAWRTVAETPRRQFHSNELSEKSETGSVLPAQLTLAAKDSGGTAASATQSKTSSVLEQATSESRVHFAFQYARHAC